MNNEKNKNIWIKKVEESLLIRGRSIRTYENYKSVINRFLNYYDNSINISKLKEDDIFKYIKDNFINNSASGNTININVCGITFLFSVCFKKSLNKKLLPVVKLRKKLPTIIPKKEFLDILNEENNLEHKCWLLLGFCCGLRVEEVASVKIENIYSNEHKLKVLGKGNKERFTILPDIVIKFLRLYFLEKKFKIKTGYLFSCHTNNEMPNSDTICNFFGAIMKRKNKLGVYSFHTLRHSFATYYLMNGGNILTLKSMLGHSSLTTTGIYAHIALNFNKIEGIKYV